MIIPTSVSLAQLRCSAPGITVCTLTPNRPPRYGGCPHRCEPEGAAGTCPRLFACSPLLLHVPPHQKMRGHPRQQLTQVLDSLSCKQMAPVSLTSLTLWHVMSWKGKKKCMKKNP